MVPLTIRLTNHRPDHPAPGESAVGAGMRSARVPFRRLTAAGVTTEPTWHTAGVPWLVTDDARVLASVEVADARSARRKGLLGRDGLDEWEWIEPRPSGTTINGVERIGDRFDQLVDAEVRSARRRGNWRVRLRQNRGPADRDLNGHRRQTDRDDLPGPGGDHGGFVQHDALAARVNQSIGSSKIDRQIVGKQTAKTLENHVDK